MEHHRGIAMLRATQTMVVTSKEEFDQMWMKALPSQRHSQITLPILAVMKDGVWYILEGELEWILKEQ